jgi:hypothetical protein
MTRIHIRRLAVRLGLDSNPMRRRTDKIASGVTAGLTALFLVGGPAATIAVQHVSYRITMAEQRGQESWRQVPAVVLRGATVEGGDYYGGGSWTWVRWKAPDGRAVTGEAMVPAGAEAGSHAPVWIDASGQYTGGPPLSRDAALLRVVAETATVPVMLALVLVAAWGVAQARLDRRRLADWETDWAATGPHWTRQFRTRGL